MGTHGFHYPELALFSTLTLPVIMFSVKQGMKKLEANSSPDETPLQDRNDDEEVETELIEQKKNYQTLKKIYSLRYLC